MAITLDATAGGASANTYCTLAEADSYHEGHYYASTWTGASDANKDIVLAWATRLLDEQMDWAGYKMTSAQTLRFPRGSLNDPDGYSIDSSIIPDFLKNATAEFARWLLASDRTAENDLQGMQEVKVGPIKIKADKYDRAPVIPLVVFKMISYYGSKRKRPARRLSRTTGPAVSYNDILTRNIFG